MRLKVKSLRTLTWMLVFSIILAVILGLPAKPASAEVVPAKISAYSISPPDTELKVGIEYTIEFTLDIAKGVEGNIILETEMEKKGTNYWDLRTGAYEGVTSDWQPGKKKISFDAAPGTPTFLLTGYVPIEQTTSILQHPLSGTVTLHQPGTLSLLSLSLESGETLESMVGEAVDDSILNYRSKTAEWRQALDENQALASQITAMAEAGHTDQAIDLIETLPKSGWGGSESSDTFLYIVLGILAVIALLAIIMMLRNRSTAGFLKQRASDQADKLDIVESRLQRLGERNLINDVTQVRDSLKEMGRR